MRRARRVLRDACGSVAVELAMGVGVLVLPIAVLVLVFPTWVERQSMARVAAQEAARAVVLADAEDRGRAAGVDAARSVAANHGLADALVDVRIDGHLVRGGSITAAVTVRVPVVPVAFIGRVGGFSWTATHAEPVDRYRSFPAD